MGGDNSKYSELARYILALCEAQNLSLRQASLRSDLEAGTISKILQRDRRSVPTPETLRKLADGLNGDFLRMMGLAGHLPQVGGEDADEIDAELYAKMQRLQDLIRQVAKKDRAAASRLMGLVLAPFEIMLTLQEMEGRGPEHMEGSASDDKEEIV